MRAATRGTAKDGGRPAPASRAPRHPLGLAQGMLVPCSVQPSADPPRPMPLRCACGHSGVTMGAGGGAGAVGWVLLDAPVPPCGPSSHGRAARGARVARGRLPRSAAAPWMDLRVCTHREGCLMAIAAATLLTGKARGDLCCWESSPASGCICPCKQLTSSPVALPGKHGLEQCCCQPRAAPQLSALSALGRGNCGHLAAGTNPCCSPRGTAWHSSETPASLPSGWTGWEAAHAGCSMDTAGLRARGCAGSPWAVPLVLQEERGCHGLGAAACWCWGVAAQGPIPPLRGLGPLLSRMLCPQPPRAMSLVQPHALRPRSAAAFLLHRPAPAPAAPLARCPHSWARGLLAATRHSPRCHPADE